jgi:precorrin-3B synthase
MRLAAIASRNGARWARPAPDRALLLGPLSEANATATSREAQDLGFIVEARDPRRRIVACPGAPACAQGLIAARALAADIARDVPLPGGHRVALHVSGCAKGCAHPSPAPLTIVGTEHGCGIIANGTARDAPARFIEPRELIATLRPASREAVNA